MKNSKPSVLLYNPISGHGHLDSWNAMFVGFLLERGYRILALNPDRKAMELRLTQRKLMDHPRLHLLDWDAPRLLRWRIKLRIGQIWKWWLVYGAHYANKRPGSRATPGMHILTRIKKRVFQFVVPPLFWASRALYCLYRQTIGAEQSSSSEDSSELHYLDPLDMAQRINAALKKSPWQPDCLFNMYLDMYKTGMEPWREFATVCRLPWGGIRFAPSEAPPPEGYYRLSSLRGMCFLDESTCQSYAAHISDKYFQYLPDVPNTELPEEPGPLAEEILCRAASRKIVFLGGSIGGQKNIARWCELIALADRRRWFFVQVGEIHPDTFSPEDIAAFERLTAAIPENMLLYAQYLPDDRHFNAVIQTADIVFAAYKDFRFSSNILSKAAHFEKPILASDGFLMANKVRRYAIGVVVPQDDVHAMLSALERLAAKPVPRVNFEAYRAAFNEQVAGDSLEKFINHVMVS